MPPCRILYTIPNFITAGSGRAMLNVIERLDRARYSPTVCVLKPGGALYDELERLDIPRMVAPFAIPTRPLPSFPLRAWRAAQVFRPHKFDLWHSFHYLDDYTEPIVARLSGAAAWCFTKKNMNWWRRSWRLRSRLATAIAAQNTTMLSEFFQSPALRAKTRLIQPGVDHWAFHPSIPPRLGLRNQQQFDGIVAAIVAHIVPVKGHEILIRAAAHAPNLILWIVGRPDDAAYVDSLKRLSAELGISGRVCFLGGVSDVPALLSEVDIFVLSSNSRGEGCPVALLEAMAAGRACIATDVPGSKDVIQSGENGLLVPAENPSALAEALRQLAGSAELRRQVGVAARKRIESQFTLDREAALYDAMYQEALKARVDGYDGHLNPPCAGATALRATELPKRNLG
jgi:glycosyltransferase involved in cell wall biosynthesis